VSVQRHDGDCAVGETVIAVGGLCPGEALSVDDAGRLAMILHYAVLAARAERPECNADEIDPFGRGVKAVENGRLHTPRLSMLGQLASALDLTDVASLIGNGCAVPVSVFAGARHAALAQVQAALTDYRVTPVGKPPSLAHLCLRLDRAWHVRHSGPDHRTQLGALLTALIRDAQRAARTLCGEERRDARRTLSGVYQLADFYVAYQSAPELVWMVADRALTEGQDR
jgi:hypothetical protein